MSAEICIIFRNFWPIDTHELCFIGKHTWTLYSLHFVKTNLTYSNVLEDQCKNNSFKITSFSSNNIPCFCHCFPGSRRTSLCFGATSTTRWRGRTSPPAPPPSTTWWPRSARTRPVLAGNSKRNHGLDHEEKSCDDDGYKGRSEGDREWENWNAGIPTQWREQGC